MVKDGVTVYGSLENIILHILAETSLIPVNLPFRGARVRMAADLVPGSAGFEIIAWDVEDRDTDGFFDLAQPTRLTSPAGVSKVQLMAYIRSPSGATGRYAYFKKNGAYLIGGGGLGNPDNTFDMSLTSDVIDVAPGDYFELEIFGSVAVVAGGAGTPAGLATWFSLQVREVS